MKSDLAGLLARPASRIAGFVYALGLFAVMVWLFREPLETYRLHSDDFEYLSASRTLDRALTNLFRPHNTHIVPVWRVLTWAVVKSAGELANLQRVLSIVAFAALVLVGIGVMGLIARETGRPWLGFAALIGVGTTSVIKSSATWYSSGQTLWAALMILLMLLALQRWRIRGGWLALLLASVAAWAAGGFWTIGHAAGPTGFAYLWADGRRRARWAALVPLTATVFSIALSLAMGGRGIDARISFHGRTEREAASFSAGTSHTMQAIPENLVLQNLGLEGTTTPAQGALLVTLLLLAWVASWWGFGHPNALECAGGTLALTAYVVEWTFRGYLPFSSLRGIVPWYDTIPHVGMVLFGSGWLARLLKMPLISQGGTHVIRLTFFQMIMLLLFQVWLVGLHAPRVENLYITDVPPLSLDETSVFITREYRLARARYLAHEIAQAQHRDLARLDQANRVAKSLGIGRQQISEIFGRVEVLELPRVYDAIGLFDLPSRGRSLDPARVRAALGPYLQATPMPRIPPQYLRRLTTSDKSKAD
jgi:hypothetical protein